MTKDGSVTGLKVTNYFDERMTVIHSSWILLCMLLQVKSHIIPRLPGPYFLEGIGKTTEQKMEDIKFLLYTRRNKNDPIYLHSDNTANYSSFNSSQNTQFLIHGILTDRHFFRRNKDAILEQRDENVIIVEWADLSVSITVYPQVIQQLLPIGEHLLKFIDNLREYAGLDFSKLHLVGHSIGAHIAGIINKRSSNGKSPRITGLDPAGIVLPENMLDKTDAECVQVVHTFIDDIWGYRGNLGHGEFYPNSGNMQTGCLVNDLFLGLCSHIRSADFHEEWTRHPGSYTGTECDSFENYVTGKCKGNKEANMLDDLDGECAQGTFYLITSGSPPYQQLPLYDDNQQE